MFFVSFWANLILAATACDAKALWSSKPATNYPNIIKEAYLLGNGKLGAMPFGSPGRENLVLNVDSLWSGGPFEAANYAGGNPSEEKYHALSGIRDWIFQNTTGNISQLLGNGDYYGSYRVLGNLSISFNASMQSRTYRRELDLRTGIHTTKYSDNAGNNFTTTVFCSYPDQVCVYQLESTSTLPEISIKLDNTLVDSETAKSTCGSDYARIQGVTQLGPPEGLKYESVAKIIGPRSPSTRCNDTQPGVLVVPRSTELRSLSIAVAAGTNYDSSKGNKVNNFSFRGLDPTEGIKKTLDLAALKSANVLKRRHLNDYQRLAEAFSLDLPDPKKSEKTETASLLADYSSSSGDPFVESLLFDYSRHLLISSSRENSLPANLQGKWASELYAAWSGDYHANINIQMNYWGAEQTGLGHIQDGLWRYMQETWVPRGTETAKLLYNAPGWVTHSEMNIFGHTAMKNDAGWANYPASGAWMMQHVTDHFSYTQDVAWLKSTGYPLLRGITEFWLSQIQEDRHWNDGTLVVNPCNSPETGPITFGCTHWQQLLHQLFTNILHLGPLASEQDKFLSNVSNTLARLDKGLHYTAWGGVKEWKLPEPISSEVYDFENNTHRHLSHLWGWYPGLSLVSPSQGYLSGYTNATIQNAIATSLYSRGEGNAADANAGWAKVWRSACWARLNNTERAYFHLKYAIEQNFVGNALSMYSGENMPFQIDANFGFAGAVLSMLVVDIEEPGLGAKKERSVVLGPAIPKTWGGGSVKGLRLRGGGKVDFGWDGEGVVKWASGNAKGVQFVSKDGKSIRGR